VPHGVPVQLPRISGGSCSILLYCRSVFGSGFSIFRNAGQDPEMEFLNGIFTRGFQA
jgi:hypothetical protein